jgi:hypothetical protein
LKELRFTYSKKTPPLGVGVNLDYINRNFPIFVEVSTSLLLTKGVLHEKKKRQADERHRNRRKYLHRISPNSKVNFYTKWSTERAAIKI